MDLELTDEQRLIRETARDFTDNEIVPRARDNDRNEHFDLDLIGKIPSRAIEQTVSSLEGLLDEVQAKQVRRRTRKPGALLASHALLGR